MTTPGRAPRGPGDDQEGLFDLPDGPAAGQTGGARGSDGGVPGRRLVVETDGGSRGNPGPAGYGAVVRDAATGEVLAERAEYLGIVSNNVAEYRGLVGGLRAAAEIDPRADVEVRADSKLVVEQMSGRWKIKHEEMRTLAEQARRVLPPAQVRYTWVPRAQNKAADALANAVMDSRGTVHRNLWCVDAGTAGASAAAAPAPEGVAPASERAAPAPEGTAPPSASADAPAGARQVRAVPGEAGVPVGASGGRGLPEEAAAARANAPRSSGTPLPPMNGNPVTVVLVRHGVTALTETGRYSGGDTPGPPLSPLGQEQVARAARIVHRIGVDLWPDLPAPSALVTSPMLRARQTGAALAAPMALPVAADDGFGECRFGDWDGLTPAEIEAGWPGKVVDWATTADVRPPGGESVRDVGARVARGLRRLATERHGSTVVVAAHTVVIRAAVGLVGLSAPARWSAVRIPPASVTIVRVWPGVDGDGRLVGDLTVVGCPCELA
ncbi:bifunctional RNase H/acid phosphatase [Georgenia sp. SYP-B2076]|uniref:bifunctional RNase H/acid phosphatase n=1 Tax=Georgenia sp. SYP-B2076 TaxID=2495881 RepID=UPI000F8CBBA1|nr:bifunctional RNase H/acid phosphatase [Georgenia sp. SYP-B2076]